MRQANGSKPIDQTEEITQLKAQVTRLQADSTAELLKHREQLAEREARIAELEAGSIPITRAVNIAVGCKDYGGGYHDEKQLAAYHHGMETVATVLRSMLSGSTLQARVVESVGAALAGKGVNRG